ncbi:glycosyltransferase [Mucilaginibacter ximonensis]|uniref:Glycosyltransferase n=1 Tax=Mucilaginibacter ximonensis TaxID=538021 RepID=A0ABW5YB70_9SPHI
METDIYISVITTIKNVDTLLAETLKSVFNQTYLNYEHIIVDDGSTDDSIAIIKDFQRHYPSNKIRLIQTSGIGRAAALNLGVKNASGAWVAIIDGDDLWHPEKLKIQADCINEDIDVLCTDAILFTSSAEINYKPIAAITFSDIKLEKLLYANRISHSTVMLRKDICDYDPNRISQLDYDLWLRLAKQGKRLCKINEPLGFHRIHEAQSFESKQGKAYKWRSFKLKLHYGFITGNVAAIGYNLTKLAFDMLFPRKLRLTIRKIFK